MNIRYVITHIEQSSPTRGMRRLTFRNAGSNTFDTPEQAQQLIYAMRSNNSPSTLAMYGTPDTLEVRAVECWPGHNDPKTIWFDSEVSQ